MSELERTLRAIKPQVVGWIDEVLASRNASGAGSASSGARFAPTPHGITSAHHSESGLTAGHVLRALSASTFGWGRLLSTDLPDPLTSATYVAGYAGWALRQNGDAEFGNVIIRGAIRSSGLSSGEVMNAGGTLVVLEGSVLGAAATSL